MLNSSHKDIFYTGVWNQWYTEDTLTSWYYPGHHFGPECKQPTICSLALSTTDEKGICIWNFGLTMADHHKIRRSPKWRQFILKVTLLSTKNSWGIHSVVVEFHWKSPRQKDIHTQGCKNWCAVCVHFHIASFYQINFIITCFARSQKYYSSHPAQINPTLCACAKEFFTPRPSFLLRTCQELEAIDYSASWTFISSSL